MATQDSASPFEGKGTGKGTGKATRARAACIAAFEGKGTDKGMGKSVPDKRYNFVPVEEEEEEVQQQQANRTWRFDDPARAIRQCGWCGDEGYTQYCGRCAGPMYEWEDPPPKPKTPTWPKRRGPAAKTEFEVLVDQQLQLLEDDANRIASSGSGDANPMDVDATSSMTTMDDGSRAVDAMTTMTT